MPQRSQIIDTVRCGANLVAMPRPPRRSRFELELSRTVDNLRTKVCLLNRELENRQGAVFRLELVNRIISAKCSFSWSSLRFCSRTCASALLSASIRVKRSCNSRRSLMPRCWLRSRVSRVVSEQIGQPQPGCERYDGRDSNERVCAIVKARGAKISE